MAVIEKVRQSRVAARKAAPLPACPAAPLPLDSIIRGDCIAAMR
ncbi:MAG: site-specific DNA-methyltransferase, partial [Sphingomonas sp.]